MIFELLENGESYQAICSGAKHYVLFFDVIREGQIQELQLGAMLRIRDISPTAKNRFMDVRLTLIEKVRNDLYALSFHHMHKNGTPCCCHMIERNG